MTKLLLAKNEEHAPAPSQLPPRSTLLRRLKSLAPKRPHMERRKLLIGGLTIAGLVLWLQIASFFLPAGRVFSFGGQNCVFNPMLLPGLVSHKISDSFSASSPGTIQIAGYPVFSYQTCITAEQPPEAGRQEVVKLAPFGITVLSKHVLVLVGELPAIHARFDPAEAVGAASTLEFSLSVPDAVFGYLIASSSQSTPCTADGLAIACPLGLLDLAQGTDYALKLEQYFDGKLVRTIIETDITTLDPVIITGSSIAPDALVYDVPAVITLATNKNLVSAGAVELVQADSGEHVSGITYELAETDLTIVLAEPLPRKTAYELRIGNLTADDNSELTAAYVLRFTTSGGPKVTDISVGTRRVSVLADPLLHFDIGLKEDQDFGTFVRLEHDGKPVPASLSLRGNSLTIRSTARLNRCADYTVHVGAGLINEHGVGNGEAWSYSFRTICQSVFSIGTSAQGRSISAYRFGSGSNSIVFVGGMHGNEKSSVATMNAWIQYLEEHAREIPAHRSIVVIPNHNPDGYASSRRTNANNVDLNRNFPANDWQSSIEMPGGQTLPEGGGKAPLDQPESRALADFINREHPRLVLTYHAVARVVISNDASNSAVIGQAYARASGYRFTTDAGSDDEFGYATTGEFEDWLGDKKGIPAILIELSYMNSSEFNAHRSAMWNIVQLP